MPTAAGPRTIGNTPLVMRLADAEARVDMATATYAEVDTGGAVAPPRWPLFVSGVVWLLFSFVILALDSTSVATVGVLLGIVLLFGAVTELVQMFLAPGWRWAHGLLAVLFLITGIGSFVSPYQTVGVFSLFIAWYLLFKGTADVFSSVAFRGE